MNMRALPVIIALLLAAAVPAFSQTATGPPVDATYRRIDAATSEVKSAAAFAVRAEQQRTTNLRLLSIVGAERQFVSGNILRLCLSMDRSGRTEFARAVVARDKQKRWSLTLWTWGSCGR